jgi:hypothetical protein
MIYLTAFGIPRSPPRRPTEYWRSNNPHLAYNVARACAVAGYTELYLELDILPDVHIAEEARECGNLTIYEAIVSQSVRYSIMNDYTRSIDLENRQPAHLNGDTAARWMLDIKQAIREPDGKVEEEDGQFYTLDMFGLVHLDTKT